MGVRGLLSYVLRHQNRGTTVQADLVEAAARGHDGVTLLVDLLDFAAWLLPQIDRGAKEYEQDMTYLVYGGEFAQYDEVLSEIVFSLRAVGVYLEFFVDVAHGCGLMDDYTGTWADEAKRKFSANLESAKVFRQWCKGEKNDLPESLMEGHCQPVLWYEQMQASLARCGCQVWHLQKDEQAPLLALGRNFEWGHAYGVVSNNIDWCLVRGLRLIPLQCFDMNFDLRTVVPLAVQDASRTEWQQLPQLTVAYTSASVLAECLRLGHPPRDEEMQEGNSKGKGKGPVGIGRWPYKWWFEHVLIELAMLCGTDSTTPFIQKHKLYQQLGLVVGVDPVDSIVRFLRHQLYTNKLRWRDFQLEGVSPVLSDLLDKDPEFAVAIKLFRAVYTKDVPGVQNALATCARLRPDAEVAKNGGGEDVKLPEASSLALRSALMGGKAWLEVGYEDFTRTGPPLAHEIVADLRHLMYLMLQKRSVQEYRVPGDQRSVVQCKTVIQEGLAGLVPPLQLIQAWPYTQRWALFRAAVQHHSIEAPSPDASGAQNLWRSFEDLRDNAGPVPLRPSTGFTTGVLEYFVSLNSRYENVLIREHEFDSLLATLALSCDVSLPASPLLDVPAQVEQRFAEVRTQLCQVLSWNFSQTGEARIPLRVGILSAWYQTITQQLLDLARLLRLDSDTGGVPAVFLPEPRELMNGSVFAALYIAGAYDDWEVTLPATEAYYTWKEVYDHLAKLRKEIVKSQYLQSYKEKFLRELRGRVKWPSYDKVQAALDKGNQQDELPIDEHRDKILKHIETHRVTCIQGETGCGKSTRVPVYIMEEYFEQKKQGTLVDDERFMVLCTQPRRIACISLANRVASCLKQKLGDAIGYKISGDSCVRAGRTKLVYVTTGYLLQVLVNNPEQIRNYSHLVLDEVHERDVDSDLLSLVVKLQMSGYNFKLVIMSATLQGDLFTRYFSDKKIKTIFVGVKRYPVEVLYVEQLLDRYGDRAYYGDFDMRKPEGTRGRPASFSNGAMRAIRDAERAFGTQGYEAEGLDVDDNQHPFKSEFDDSSDSDSEESEEDGQQQQTAVATQKLQAKRRRREVTPQIMRGLDALVFELVTRVAAPGEGILIFLPGISEITELHETLQYLETDKWDEANWHGIPQPQCHFKVFALHSLIPKDEQEGAVFDEPPSDTCHVILSSNIAESSLTIPKVRVVIDFGLRRQLVYDKRRHMSCLVTAWVSQASAKQRCGRTGRVFEGVNIRLYTRQFYESYMEEFDAPEMQTAPLEKLYVNVKHLSAKLPEYEVAEGERRRRTPKELLQLTAQPPDIHSIESSIQLLDNLGALTNATESAELTVLGYLMMSVPLDVQLCRLVLFGAMMNLPCDGVVIASVLSVQDPFTLPSHLIIKDPREYAEALKRSYDTRQFFDQGTYSEPLMLRALFVHFLTELRRGMVERAGKRGRGNYRESNRTCYLRAAQSFGHKHAIVPKRIVHLATSVLDTSSRTRKFLPEGSDAQKKLDGLIALLQCGERNFESVEEAEKRLLPVTELFSQETWTLKGLLIMAFTPQFMRGGTKIRSDGATDLDARSWKKKKVAAASRKDKNKMEQLREEIVDLGLDPTKTVLCALELGGKGNRSLKWQPHFMDDLIATFKMMVCGEPFSLKMSGDNRAFITFEDGSTTSTQEESEGVKIGAAAELKPEAGLVKDLPVGAHFLDLYGAGRFKFTVPLINSQYQKRKEEKKEEQAAREKGKGKGKSKKGKGEQSASESTGKGAAPPEQDAAAPKLVTVEEPKAESTANEDALAATTAKQEPKEEKAEVVEKSEGDVPSAEDKPEAEKKKEDDGIVDASDATDASGAKEEASTTVPAVAEGAPLATESDSKEQEKTTTLEAEPVSENILPDAPEQEELPHLMAQEADAEAWPEEEEEETGAAAEEEDDPADAEELGPPIGVFKPVSPYEINWEVIEEQSFEPEPNKKGKVKKKRVIKGRCGWRNAVGFLGSTELQNRGAEPWPNDFYAVYTTMQGGDSKEVSWVDGVCLLSAEGESTLAFLLLVAFLRGHQDLQCEVDLQEGKINAFYGLNGLEHKVPDGQVLLLEDIHKLNAVRRAASDAFYNKIKAKPGDKDVVDKGIDFSGYQSRRDDEAVPQLASSSVLMEAFTDLVNSVREAQVKGQRRLDVAGWTKRKVLRKPCVKVVPLHQGKSKESEFELFSPFLDVVQLKAHEEHAQREEDERKRRLQDDKRRREEEARQRKDEERRRREEEKRAAKLEAKQAAKGAGKSKSKHDKSQQPLDDQPQKGKGKHKGEDSKGHEGGKQGKKGEKAEKAEKGRGRNKKEARKEDGEERFPAAASRSAQSAAASTAGQPTAATPIPGAPGWSQVLDPQTERYYYWHQKTGNVTWVHPVSRQLHPGPGMSSWGAEFGAAGYGGFFPGYGMPGFILDGSMPSMAGASGFGGSEGSRGKGKGADASWQ